MHAPAHAGPLAGLNRTGLSRTGVLLTGWALSGLALVAEPTVARADDRPASGTFIGHFRSCVACEEGRCFDSGFPLYVAISPRRQTVGLATALQEGEAVKTELTVFGGGLGTCAVKPNGQFDCSRTMDTDMGKEAMHVYADNHATTHIQLIHWPKQGGGKRVMDFRCLPDIKEE